MGFLDSQIKHLKLQYKVLVIMLVLFLVLGKYWAANPDSVVDESYTTAKVVAVTLPDHQASGVGSGMTFATVQLDSGERARVSLRALTPSVGDRIDVKVRNYSSGNTQIFSSNEF